jgi:hypothetical protein
MKRSAISIITPSIRKEGLYTVAKALSRQTFRDFEWLIGTPVDPQQKDGVWVEDDFTGGYWTLNRIYNKLIEEASGSLIVSWQDFTFADPDALEKFWFHYETEPKTLVTAVGNKYESVYPEPRNMLWKDPREREDQGSYYSCFFNDIEWNLCSIPKEALYAVGGFDEGLDFLGFGMDGYSVNERLNDLGGRDFKINQTIKSYSLVHGRIKDWDKDNLLGKPYQDRKKELIAKGVWPVLNYLQKSKEGDSKTAQSS